MSELNKIFYGPAGTGKTREAIIEAISILKKSNDVNSLEFIDTDNNNFDNILKTFKKASNLLSLKNIPIEYVERIEKESNMSKIFGAIPREYEISLDEIEAYKSNHNKYPLIETVTFHPSYSYQDFVEGIGVETTKDKKIIYEPKDGIFKKICERAINNPEYNYILIIDEINRGDISSIFGELFTLLEDTKRKNEDEELSINLPYSKDKNKNPKKLVVPKNLYILATMNTVDKSIALIDVALRRRFEFIECLPKTDLKELTAFDEINLPKFLKAVNERISILKNEHYQIGHSYFLNIKDFSDFKNVMKKKIIPLLQEYFYDDWQSICAVLNQSYDKNPQNNKILILNQSDKNIFLDEFDELRQFRNKKIFKLSEEYTQNDIKIVYE